MTRRALTDREKVLREFPLPKWRSGATLEELAAVNAIDAQLLTLHKAAADFTSLRSRITQRCNQRALKAARNLPPRGKKGKR